MTLNRQQRRAKDQGTPPVGNGTAVPQPVTPEERLQRLENAMSIVVRTLVDDKLVVFEQGPTPNEGNIKIIQPPPWVQLLDQRLAAPPPPREIRMPWAKKRESGLVIPGS